MSPALAIEIKQRAATLGSLVAAPRLATARVVGVVVSLIQAVTHMRRRSVATHQSVFGDDCDEVLIDTPGRGASLGADIYAVRSLLKAIAPNETQRALPAGLNPALARRHLSDTLKQGATLLAATKPDECPNDWTLVELAADLDVPMRWVTDGQEGPTAVRWAGPRLRAVTGARAEAVSRRVAGRVA